MKKKLLKAAVVAIGVMMCGSAWADTTPSLKVIFNGTSDPTIKTNDGKTDYTDKHTVSGGHLVVNMQPTKGEGSATSSRGDIKLNFSSAQTKTDGDVIFAIKFIGNKPSPATDKTVTPKLGTGDLNTSSADIALSALSTKSNNSNYIYYGTINTTNTTYSSIQIKIADAALNSTYTLDWVATFASVDALTAYVNGADDGNTDTDEGNVVNTSTGITYKELNKAVTALSADDNTIQLNGATTETGNVAFKYKVTITGNNNTVNLQGKRCTIGAAKTITINNLTFDGGSDKTYTSTPFEAGTSGAVANLTGVTFKDCRSTAYQGIVCIKGSNTATLSGVTFDNCSASYDTSGTYVAKQDNQLIWSNGTLTIDGTLAEQNSCSYNTFVYIYNNSTKKFTVGNDFSYSGSLKVEYNNTDKNTTAVNGSTDVTKFDVFVGSASSKTDYTLKVNGSNLDFEGATEAKIGTTKYASLYNAIKAATNGQTVKLIKNVELNSRLEMPALAKDQNIIVDGDGKSIIRKTGNAGNLMILVSCDNAATFTFKNLVVDGNSIETTNSAVEVNKQTSFEGCTFINHNIPAGNAIIKSASSNAIMVGTTTLKDNGTSHVFYFKQDKRVDDNDASYTDGTNAVVPTIELASDYTSETTVVRNVAESKSQLSASKYTIDSDGWALAEIASGTDKYSLKAVKTTKIVTPKANCQGYVTFYDADNAYSVDRNAVRIYTATQPSAGASTISLNYVEDAVATINKGQAVVLRNLNGTTSEITLTATTDANTTAYDYNALKAATTEGSVSNAYVLGYLAGEGNGFGFYPYSAAMNVGQVYVTTSSGAKKLTIKFSDDAATAINNVNANTSTSSAQAQGKFIKGGKLVIVKNGKHYNAAGALIK